MHNKTCQNSCPDFQHQVMFISAKYSETVSEMTMVQTHLLKVHAQHKTLKTTKTWDVDSARHLDRWTNSAAKTFRHQRTALIILHININLYF